MQIVSFFYYDYSHQFLNYIDSLFIDYPFKSRFVVLLYSVNLS